MIATSSDTTVRHASRRAPSAFLLALVRLLRPVSPPPAVPSAWVIPTLADDDPGREAYALLGTAWRSSTTRAVATGGSFDAVETEQRYAGQALERLRALGASRGAVSAEGDRWTFFIPLGSGRFAWPPSVTYISGPAVRLPPRSARGAGFSLRWISRGEPTGKFLTPPDELVTVLTEITPVPSPRHPCEARSGS